MIRTRFAPSPTGFMHVGSIRTALYNYLLAKKSGGRFILRIEDTDQARFVKEAQNNILETLKWTGLDFDEGPGKGGDYGPYVQSQRLDGYKKHVQKLLDQGQAYFCFCSSERLEELRKRQTKNKRALGYDQHCRNLPKKEVEQRIRRGEPYIVRFQVPEGRVQCQDQLRGEVSFNLSEVDDFVIQKSDGFPTYHLAVVVDDALMKITHVIRGEEWLPSLPKHVLLYQAFKWKEPVFVHLPLILTKDRKKLSKRHGDVCVKDFQDKGYLPESLLNFILFLGWNPGDNREFFTLKEMVEEFSLDKLNKSSSIFDMDKLDWMNGHYIREMDLERLVGLATPFMEKTKLIDQNTNPEKIREIIRVEQERMKKLSDIADSDKIRFFFERPIYDKKLLLWKKQSFEQTKEQLSAILDLLEGIQEDEFKPKFLKTRFLSYIEEKGFKVGEVLWPFRVALSGLKASPDPFDISGILGSNEVKKRIQHAIQLLT